MSNDAFTGIVKVKCFPHWPNLVKEAAARRGAHVSEYIRSAIAERLGMDGFDLAPPKPVNRA